MGKEPQFVYVYCLAMDVENTSGGDMTKITSSGYVVNHSVTRTGFDEPVVESKNPDSFLWKAKI
jgi:hypothetical protein